MDIPWNDVRLFLAVAETGSMSGAAKVLRLGQPTVSRRLAELERQLGYPVFVRSVSGVALTAAGEQLIDPARNMATWAAELERAADGRAGKPRGVVRVTAPPGVAFDFLAPFAASLRSTLPQVRLEVVSSIGYADLGRGEADLALRMRASKQRELVTLASLHFDNAAFAAPAYVRRLGKTYGFADVDWIAWARPLDALSPNPELAALIPGFAPVFASDDFVVQMRAARAGVGAMMLGAVLHRHSLLASLRRLDLDLGRHARGALHLVASKRALLIPRVRAVADRIVDHLDAMQD